MRKTKMISMMIAVIIFAVTATFTKAYASDFEPVKIDSDNFPDDAFRAVIKENFDSDGDGVLSEDEIVLARDLWCVDKGIRSLKGIEYLVELRGLYCMDNEIETMDLSHNKELQGVWCSGNRFTSLDFTPNPALEWVYCFDCQLTSLNVSNNPLMSYIECSTNPLGAIDVSHNPKLEHLMCASCGLTSLDLSGNPNLQHLDAFNNSLKTLDVTGCPRLKRLDIWENQGLGSIDVSNNPGLQYYNCAFNGAVSVDVSHNPELIKLSCGYNSIKVLDLSANPKLVYLDCACNEIGNLDLSANRDIYFLQAFTNPFTALDIGYNPLLIQTYNEGVKKEEYEVCQGHSWTIDYGGENSTEGDNIFFLCIDDKVKLDTVSKIDASKAFETDDENVSDTSELITREQAVQTLYEMAGRPAVDGLNTRFKDVEAGSWYSDSLLWGEKYTICIGYPYVSADTFGVGRWVSKQDLLLMLMRYSEYKGYKRAIDFGRSDDYTDYYDIDYYAWEAVTWAATWRIINSPDEMPVLNPHGYATKAEFEDMIRRMLEVNGEVVPEHIVIAEGKDSGVNSASGETMGSTTLETEKLQDEVSEKASESMSDKMSEKTSGIMSKQVSEPKKKSVTFLWLIISVTALIVFWVLIVIRVKKNKADKTGE